MGTTEHLVQGRGPQPSGGGDVVAEARRVLDSAPRSETMVKVIWETVTSREVYLPTSVWHRLDGDRLGPAGDTNGHIDAILRDIEADDVGDVIERSVKSVEHGFAP